MRPPYCIFRRGLSHRSVNRGNTHRLPKPNRGSLDANLPSLATAATLETSSSRNRRTTDKISIMNSGSAGYMPFNASAFSPFATNFVPLQQNQPAYSLPLGQGNGFLPPPPLVQPPLFFDTMTQQVNALFAALCKTPC
jgi:hypothetical protein